MEPQIAAREPSGSSSGAASNASGADDERGERPVARAAPLHAPRIERPHQQNAGDGAA